MGNFKSPKQGTAQPTQSLPADNPPAAPGVKQGPVAPPSAPNHPEAYAGYMTGEADIAKMQKQK